MLILFLYFNKTLNNHINVGWGPFLGELKISPCHPGISLSLLYPIWIFDDLMFSNAGSPGKTIQGSLLGKPLNTEACVKDKLFFSVSRIHEWVLGQFFPGTFSGTSGCKRTTDVWGYLPLKDQCARRRLPLLVWCPSASNSLGNWILSILWNTSDPISQHIF